MLQVLGKVLNSLKSKHDDDLTDRANYVYTSLMFGFFALTIAAKQYVGEPLQCWIPPEFKGNWEKYSENYCFVENTYYLDIHADFPSQEDRKKNELHYYQWVSFMMVAQLFLFLLPKTVCGSVNFPTGLSVESMVTGSAIYKKENKKHVFNTHRNIDRVVDHFDRTLTHNKKKIQKVESKGNLRADRRMDESQSSRKKRTKFELKSFDAVYRYVVHRSSIANKYLFYKLWNLVNSVGQLYLINEFLGTEYRFWGWDLLVDLYNGRQWKQSGRFPRVTFCDIQVRDLADTVPQYTIQCVLMINMFNEKIYLFIWFWLCGLSLLNFVNLVWWIYDTHCEASLVRYVRTRLRYEGLEVSAENARNFIRNVLFIDGVTALRLIEINSGEVNASELLHKLWIRADQLLHSENSSAQSVPYGDSSAPLSPTSLDSNMPGQKHANMMAAAGVHFLGPNGLPNRIPPSYVNNDAPEEEADEYVTHESLQHPYGNPSLMVVKDSLV
ncbi:Innexin [Aphelenchoides fujianensis]|nr:Innexin [Aphelenchoides fujianensis]